MPELPEVETIKKAVDLAVCGETITKIEVFSPKMRTSLAEFNSPSLVGLTITKVTRRGRYLLLTLSDNRVILMHFGMSGVLRLEPNSVPKRKHEHIFFHLSNNQLLRFECTRRFSMCELCENLDSNGIPLKLSLLGPEPLSEDFTPEYLFNASRKRHSSVKNFIMDNANVVGVGNIYATEALFFSNISPLRKADSLTKKEAENLVLQIKKVLQKAIEAGGTTISDYRHVDGSEGKFVQNLKMYGRSGKECLTCGNTILQAKIGGRTSCYCPKCQK